MSENLTPSPAPLEPSPAGPEAPKRKHRRRWPWVVGGLFVVVLLLVLLVPTIVSLGFIRAMIVPKVSSTCLSS